MDKLIKQTDAVQETRKLIDQYIESKKLAWSPTTIRSERYRLYAVATILHGNPVSLWGHLESKGAAPYARLTTWTRVVGFVDWLIGEGLAVGPNKYALWRKANARVFKNAYTRKPANFTYEEAICKVEQISNPGARAKAKQLLESGMRFTESLTLVAGQVVGKGGKSRRVYTTSQVEQISYPSIYRHCKSVGIKPHELRKVALSRIVELGASPFELCEIAGWASVSTAQSYIKIGDRRIEGLLNQLKK